MTTTSASRSSSSTSTTMFPSSSVFASAAAFLLLSLSALSVDRADGTLGVVWDDPACIVNNVTKPPPLTFTKKPVDPGYGPPGYTLPPTPAPEIATPAPTAKPPDPECIDEASMKVPELFETNWQQDGGELPAGVVEISERDVDGGTSVQFRTSQLLGSSVEWFAVEYPTSSGGAKTCSDYNNVDEGPIAGDHVAKCSYDASTGLWTATVTVYASGDGPEFASLPPPPAADDSECYLPPGAPVAAATYTIPCGVLCETEPPLVVASVPPPCVDEDRMEPDLVSSNFPYEGDLPSVTPPVIVERSDDGLTVGFEVVSDDSRDYVAVEYVDASEEKKCALFKDVKEGAIQELFAAACGRDTWTATVTVWYSSGDAVGDLPETTCDLPSPESDAYATYELPCATLCVKPPCVEQDKMEPTVESTNIEPPMDDGPPPEISISIVERSDDGLTVGFKVAGIPDEQDNKYVGIEYTDVSSGQRSCSEYQNLQMQDILDEFLASCGSDTWSTTVTVYTYDERPVDDTAVMPTETSCSLPKVPGVGYTTYELPCASLCVVPLALTDEPTMAPTETPTPPRGPAPCIDHDAMKPKLIESNDDKTDLGDDLLKITRRSEDGSSVEFTSRKKEPEAEWVFVQYDDGSGPTCQEFRNVQDGLMTTSVRASCTRDWITTVTVYVYSPGLFPADTFPADAQSSICTLPTDGHVASYTYEVPCAELCEPTQATTTTPTTAAPTTAAPTTAAPLETAAPTVCVPKTEVERIGDFGDFEPTEEVMQILQQSTDGKSVTVIMNQAWKFGELDWIGAQYESLEDGTVCYDEYNAFSGPLQSTFTAKCVDGYADFKVFVRDECFLPVMGITASTRPVVDASIELLPPSDRGAGADEPAIEPKPTIEVIEQPTDTQCPKPELINHDGVTDYKKMPIDIIAYGNEKVTFRVSQTWKSTDSVSWIATHFPTSSYTAECPKVETVAPDQKLVYSAYCTEGKTNVTVYIHDGQFSGTQDNSVPPVYCHGNSPTKKVGYTFEIPCSCPSSGSARRLVAAVPSPSVGICELQGGTLTAIYRVPCSPGCDEVEPLSIELPTRPPVPTVPPTEAPTPKATDPPTVKPTECVPRMEAEMFGDFGGFIPSEDALQILKQSEDGETVTVLLHQAWKLTELDWVGAEYEAVGGRKCYGEENVISGPLKSALTAKCVDGLAEIDVFARDDCFLEVVGMTASASVGDDGSTDPLTLPSSVVGLPTARNCPAPELISAEGATPFPSMPIEIVSYGEDKVSFRVKQVWKRQGSLKWIATQFLTSSSSVDCRKQERFSFDRDLAYSAFCLNGEAEVTLYPHDDESFSKTEDTSSPPSFCGAGSGANEHTAGYKFKIPCGCPHQRRQLLETDGSCDLQGGTVRAKYVVPCNPGCDGIDLLSLPVPEPTEPPTPTPTAAPTPTPTAAPTSTPTECVPKTEVEQVGDFGRFNPHEDILQLLKQSPDGKTVTVQLHQSWKFGELDWIGAEYNTNDGLVCYGEENAFTGPVKSTFTAACVEGMARFDVFVRDDCFTEAVVGIAGPLGAGNLTGLPDVENPLALRPAVIQEPTLKNCPRPVLQSQDGDTRFDSMPIEIVSYGEKNVVFKVKQVWKHEDKVEWIAAHFPTGPSSVDCRAETDLMDDRQVVHTATCNADGFADVSLYVSDNHFSPTGDTCSPPNYCVGGRRGSKTAGYNFRVPCSCNSSSRRRLAQTSGSCDLQGGTLTATFNVPCNPGCGVPPLDLPIPAPEVPPQLPTPEEIEDTIVYAPEETELPPVVNDDDPTPAPTAPPPQCEGVAKMKVEDMTGIGKPMEGTMVLSSKEEAMTAPADFVVPYWSDGSKVKFKGHQYWLEKRLSWVCFVWPQESGWVGKKQEGMSNNDERTFEAKCDANGVATVYVYAHDGQIPSTSVALYPKVCGGGDQDRTVGYKVEIPCSVCGEDDEIEGEQGYASDVAIREQVETPVETVEALDTPDDSPTTPSDCPVVEMDFNDVGLTAGMYITDQLKASHGITVSAWAKRKGYTPDGAARVFDTANPGTNNDNGDPDLGSPNNKCPGGGPGYGKGGEPGSDFENCEPQGFVLIVQERNSKSAMEKYWDDNAKGGKITFEFDNLVDVGTVYILDIDEKKPVTFDVTTKDEGFQERVVESPPEYHGDNGLFPLHVNVRDVSQLVVNFPGSGSVAQINYRPHVCP